MVPEMQGVLVRDLLAKFLLMENDMLVRLLLRSLDVHDRHQLVF